MVYAGQELNCAAGRALTDHQGHVLSGLKYLLWDDSVDTASLRLMKPCAPAPVISTHWPQLPCLHALSFPLYFLLALIFNLLIFSFIFWFLLPTYCVPYSLIPTILLLSFAPLCTLTPWICASVAIYLLILIRLCLLSFFPPLPPTSFPQFVQGSIAVADTILALEQHMTLLAVILSLAAIPKLSKVLQKVMRSCCVPSKSQLIALAPDHVIPRDDSCQI